MAYLVSNILKKIFSLISNLTTLKKNIQLLTNSIVDAI